MSSQIKIMETNKKLCDMKGYNICESKHTSKALKISSKNKKYIWRITGNPQERSTTMARDIL